MSEATGISDFMSPPQRLRLTLLGRFAVEGEGVREITAKKNRGLLAILALSPGGEATREKICGLLWGDRSEEQARQSLRQSLAILRKELGTDHAGILVTRDEIVGLQLDRIDVDAIEFLSVPRESTSENLARAASLYAGELLADVTIHEPTFDDWLAEQRRRAADRAVGVFEQLAAMTDNPARLAHAKRLVDLDPLREASHRALMQVYFEAGENGLALRQYETCARLLKDEIGVEPAPATQELRQRLLSNISSAKPNPTPAAGPISELDEQDTESISTHPMIVVVPFRCPGGDPDQQVFADGISDDLARELRRFNEIKVVRAATGLRLDKGERAFDLSGSVRRAGNQMRIVVQLTALDSGQLVWSEKYDRNAADVFAVQDEIIETCVYNLVNSVNQLTLADLRKARSKNLSAYELFIEGRASCYLFSKPSLEAAAKHLRRAVELEPGFAAAHAWLAETCWLSWWAGWRGPGDEPLLEAHDHARKAVELDSVEAHGFAKLGQALLFLGEPEQARMALQKALSLNPHDPDVIAIDALYWLYRGETSVADAVVREAIRYDPNGHYGLVHGLVHLVNEQWRDAASALMTVRAKIPDVQAWLAGALAMSGRPDAARAAAVRYVEECEPLSVGFDRIGWIMHRHPFALAKHDLILRGALALAGLDSL